MYISVFLRIFSVNKDIRRIERKTGGQNIEKTNNNQNEHTHKRADTQHRPYYKQLFS